MKIVLCTNSELYQAIEAHDGHRIGAIIAPAEDIDKSKLQGIPYISRNFNTRPFAQWDERFSSKDAAAYATFFLEWKDQLDVLYCSSKCSSHCCAIAAALARANGEDDIPFWRSFWGYLDSDAYISVLEALGISPSDQEIDERETINEQSFMEARQKIWEHFTEPYKWKY